MSVRSEIRRSASVVAGLALSFVVASPVLAAGWALQTSGTTNGLYGVAMRADNPAKGIVVGGSGAVRVTSDYGKTWTAGNSGTGMTLYDVSYAAVNIAVAVGSNGTTLKTVDDGATWTTISSGTTDSLYDVSMGTMQYGIAVGAGGRVLKTTTYGNGWSVISAGITSTLLGVDMLSDGSTAWAVGMNGTIAKTVNGGSGWGIQTSGVTTQLAAVSVVDVNTAYAVGANRVILKTANGGATWVAQSATDAPSGTSFYDVSFKSATEGTVVGTNGVILNTTDGGATWRMNVSGIADNFDGLYVEPSSSRRWATAMGGKIVVYDDIAPAMPLELTAASPTADTTPTFTWNAASDTETAVTYEVMKDGVGSTNVGGALTYTVSPAWTAGNHDLRVRAVDAALNVSTWSAPFGIVIDNTVPSIAGFTPTSAVVNVPVTFQITASDNVAVTSCRILVNDVPLVGDATYNAGTGKWEKVHTFTIVANPGVKASCSDGAGNSMTTASVVVSVTAAPAADTTPPTVGAIAPAIAVVGAPVTLSATFSDNVGVNGCVLWVDGLAVAGMTLGGTSASASYTFATAGSHTAQAKCSDAATNNGSGALTTITVSASDTAPPIVSGVSPTSASVGVPVTLSATYLDDLGVVSCTLSVGGVNQGAMTVAGGVASKSYTFASVGTTSVQVACNDAVGNNGVGIATSVVVASAGSGGTVPSAIMSTVGASPSALTADGTSVSTVTVTVKNATGTTLAGKTVSLSSSRPSQDTIATIAGTTNDLGVATFTVRSSTVGSSTLTAVVDGIAIGYAPVTFSAVGTTPPGTPGPGSLVKLACPTGAAPSHQCKAVYYLGADGKRHAFPNDKAYFTWYGDFASVVTVSDAFMYSLPLGKNVTYRPGLRLVKFRTLNTIYVVSRGGLLRAIASEAIAKTLYGNEWGGKVDDLDDTIYMNYAFGTDVASPSDYHPTTETSAVTNIDADM